MFALRRTVSKLNASRLNRFTHTLALLETAGAKLTPSSLSTITAAKAINKPITVLLVGPEAKEAAAEAASLAGVENVLIQADARYEHYVAEQVTPLVVSLLKEKYTSFVVPASSMGKSVLPRAGAILDIQPLSDIVKVVDASTFVRPTYAGNAMLTVQSTDSIVMTSVRGSAFEAAQETKSESSPIEEIAAVDSDCKTEWVSEQLMTSDKPDLGSAKIVVSGGRALNDKETFDSLLNPLAEKLGAAIGASRAAVDSGFCDNSLQVGQTGKIIAPDVYIGIGISGAIQHLAGMKDSKVIVAINKDEESPIFKIADVGLVGDLYEIIPELTKKL